MRLTWPGFNEKRSVIIPLAWRELSFPETSVRIEDEFFQAKHELHVTLIGKHLGGVLLDKIERDPDLVIRLEHRFQEIDWTYSVTGPLHLLARTPERRNENGMMAVVTEKTIILRLNMPGVSEFYDYLGTSGLIDPCPPVPPPHVTLYTWNCPGGIGVSADSLLDKLTSRQFTLAEFNLLLRRP